jgi:tetratricopeptide (TPR) repeat protein
MSRSRLEAFLEMLQTQPDEAMIWYGVAAEYLKLGERSQAIDALRNVIRLNPEYTAAFQMLGTTLLETGEQDEARRVWQQGIEIATRTGAMGARNHMERLLASLGEDAGGKFCQ